MAQQGYRDGVRLNPVLDELGAYPITEIQERVRRMRDAGERIIDFSIGDPREPTPPFIPEAMRAAIPAVSQYPTPSGLPSLRRAIADYVARRYGVEVDPETQVLPAAGAKEAIFSTPFAFVDRAADEVVVYGTPGYPIYERGARFAGAAVHPVRLGGDFVLRSGDIPAEVWPQARLLWTCTPHNPTGAITSAEDLARLYASCREHGTLLLGDECYSDLYGHEPSPSVLQAGVEGALVYLSCSKRSGMTGYRSGAIVGDAAAIAALRSMRSSAGVASPEFVQEAAAAAWGDDEHAAERREIFDEKRRVLRKAFDDTGHRVVASTAGLYLWVGVADDSAVTAALLDHGVVVSPGSAFGPGGEGYIRLALVPTVEDCEEAVEVLVACLTGN